jgi:hypothetical protein
MRAQFGEALVLAGGSDSHPQFLQPVLKNLGEVKAFNITETDHLMAANRHVLKLADKATPETALYGLRTRGQAHEAVRELPLNRSARCKGAAQGAPATTINLQKYDRGRPNRDVGVRAHHRPIDKPLIGRQAESARSPNGQTRTSSLGPHVRFRRGQTLVREGSPLVKQRNSA